MSTVLEFRPVASTKRRERAAAIVGGEIVIFPGVRIERHDRDLDLGHRVLDSAGNGDFHGLGSHSRPRRTS
jgi:hypothetical protein